MTYELTPKQAAHLAAGRGLDPVPEQPWRPVSSDYARREAREACAAAVKAAKERRGEKYGEGR